MLSILSNPLVYFSDGCDDVAVGAPGGDQGQGVVYVYRGSRLTGLNPAEMQIIRGKEIRFVKKMNIIFVKAQLVMKLDNNVKYNVILIK